MKKVFSLLLATVILLAGSALPALAANGEDFHLDFEVWNPVAGDGSEIQWSSAKTEVVPRDGDKNNHALKLTKQGLDVRGLGLTGDSIVKFDFMFPESTKTSIANKHNSGEYLSNRFLDVRFGDSLVGSLPNPILFQYYANTDTMMLDISSDEAASYNHTRVANFGFNEWHTISLVFHKETGYIDLSFDGTPFTKSGVNFRVYPDGVKNNPLALIACRAPFSEDGGELYIDNFSVGAYSETSAAAETLSGKTENCEINEGFKVVFPEKPDQASISLNNVDYTACFEKSEDGKTFTYNGYKALSYGTSYTLSAVGSKGLGTVLKATLLFTTMPEPEASRGCSMLYNFDDSIMGNSCNLGKDENARVEIVTIAKDGNENNKAAYIKNGADPFGDGSAQFGMDRFGMKGTVVLSFDFMLPLSMKDKMTSDFQSIWLYFKQPDGKLKSSQTNMLIQPPAEGGNSGRVLFRGTSWGVGGWYTFDKWHHIDMVIETEYGSFDVYFDGVKADGNFSVIGENGKALTGSGLSTIKGLSTNMSNGEIYLDNVKVSEAISNVDAMLDEGVYTSKLINKSVADETISVIVTVVQDNRLQYVNVFSKTVPAGGMTDLSLNIPAGNTKIMFWKNSNELQPYSRFSIPVFEG